MSPEVLRRKLQKKAKHKPYRKCPACGGRMTCRVMRGGAGWRLFKVCDCGHGEELFWSGGGTGRHIPDGGNAGTGKA